MLPRNVLLLRECELQPPGGFYRCMRELLQQRPDSHRLIIAYTNCIFWDTASAQYTLLYQRAHDRYSGILLQGQYT